MGKECVLSKYVFIFRMSDGTNLVYNSLTNSFLEVGDDVYNVLNDNDTMPAALQLLSNDDLRILQENKIIVGVGDDDAFLNEHQYETNVADYNSEYLFLTLVPTLSCNCSCNYCFEKSKNGGVMSSQTIDALMSFVNTHQRVKGIHIVWFGGEPLLAFGTIKDIIYKFEQNVNVPIISQSMVTNGFLFDKKMEEFFSEYPLNTIQITLEGGKKRHDIIRKLNNGSPTFDKIIDNVGRLLSVFQETQINIRVNIEKENIEDYYILSDILLTKWKTPNLHVYPGFLFIDDDNKRKLSCRVYSGNEKSRVLLDIKQKYAPEELFPRLSNTAGCTATMTNAYIIGPEGEIYKCWKDVGDKDKIVGSIVSGKMTNAALYYRYMQESKWYNRQECKDCSLLPVCDGGCANDYLRTKHDCFQMDTCAHVLRSPQMLHSYLEAYYKHLKMK